MIVVFSSPSEEEAKKTQQLFKENLIESQIQNSNGVFEIAVSDEDSGSAKVLLP